MKPRSTSVCDELDADAVADVEALEAAHDLAFGASGREMRTHVPFSEAPVTIAVEALADARSTSSSAAADLRTCRSTLSALSSCSVQWPASAASSSSR